MLVKNGGLWLLGPIVGVLVEVPDADRSDLERAECLVDAISAIHAGGYSLVLLPTGIDVDLSESSRRSSWWRSRRKEGASA